MARNKYGSLRKRLRALVLMLGPGDCWPFRGYKETTGKAVGYGKIWFNGRTLTVEQATYLITHGDIPDGMKVAACPILRDCCNPAHIGLATESGTVDKMLRSRNLRRKVTHTPKLTDLEVLAIYLSTSPTSELAEKYQVSQAYICNIRAGRKHQRITRSA